MKAPPSKSAIGRAAAAAALAVLLAACGKDVRVSGGGGGALPTEERLRIFPHKTGSGGPVRPSSRPARPTVSDFVRDRASWTTPDDYLGGAHAAYTDLLSVAERAAIPAAGMSAAAKLRPAVAQDPVSYTRSPPYTRVRPDNDAFWQEEATNRGAQEEISRFAYWANSGVSQSSRGAPSGKVGDRVHAEVGWSGSNPTFRVGLRHYTAGSLADWTLDSESPNRSASYFARWTEPYGPTHGGRGGAFRTGVPGGGNVTLVVRTDRTGAEDADWLATGMWWTRATSASPGSFGVFADGGDPVFAGAGDGDPAVEQARLRRLTGTATYTGASHGVFSYADADANANRNVPFQGRATLTADFGDASAYGSVSGSIHDMKSGGPVYIPGDPRITLGGHLSPGLQRRGMFKGGARMTWDRKTWSGKWGGQFFGPSSAAGTFGVAADAGHSFIGTFEVHAPGFSITDAALRPVLSEWALERSLWTPTAAERAGPHAAYTDLVSVGERHLVDSRDIDRAAGFAPSFARVSASYTRPAPYTRVRPDGGAFWQEYATDTGAPAQRSRVAYEAASGVSQSSRGASGRVGDRVHAEVGWSGSDPTFRVELRDGTSGPLTHWAFDSESPNRPAGYFTRWTAPDGAAHGGRGGAFRSGVPGGGNMWLFVRTDRTGAADTDWLATGMWWASTTSAPYGFFGVFADGGDPVHGNVLSLAGTATYTGAAHGLFSYYFEDDVAGDEHYTLFQGTARLAADFGGASAHGSVSGRIDGMKSGDRLIPQAPAITLGEASLDHNAGRHLHPGAFTGSASMTYAGENYSGKWGGQFFGNAAAGAAGAGAHPSSAAGTFGVAAGGHAFVGTFEVHR